ncbi:MAG TPA: ParB/RepB/Spo0J family partition protein [Candidatus Sulfotelmatobacter sp.]|nr:ParB/RepB/Spo0J family partition protein [Candidatus Sulfotelmatobacter sp.]
MTTTAAVEKVAGHPGEKEKMEKRRALGRGLESLLPGPRVVTANPAGVGARVGSGGGASTQQIPHFVRNDKPLGTVTAPDNQVVTATDTELRSGQPGAAASTFDRELDDELDVPLPGENITIQAVADTARTPGNLVVNLAIDDIDKNPYQTRYGMDDELLEELAESIRINGVVQPVVVRPAEKEGRYVLILGQRRCLASKMADKTTVPALVKRVSEQQAAEMTIVENLQREDLSPLEHAEAFRVLSQKFSLTQQQIGERVGLSRESVSNYMRLLKLPKPVMEYMAQKKIGFGEARELLKLEDPAMIQKAADDVVRKRMPFDQIEEMVMRMQGMLDPLPGTPGHGKQKSGSRWVDPNVRAAQGELERLLGVRVRIKDRKGKGKIVIEYHTVNDYERVVGMLKKQ